MMMKDAIDRNERAQRSAEGGANAHLIDAWTRRETASERRARIARRRVDPETVAALTRLWKGDHKC